MNSVDVLINKESNHPIVYLAQPMFQQTSQLKSKSFIYDKIDQNRS